MKCHEFGMSCIYYIQNAQPTELSNGTEIELIARKWRKAIKTSASDLPASEHVDDNNESAFG